MAGAALSTQAAISVGPGGTGVLPFSTLPPNTEWSSRHVLPNSGTAITTVAGLDAPVQTNTAAAINTTLATVAGVGANNNAQWDSTNLRIGTRPTGNSYQLLMGQFQNNIGDDSGEITISFDATINAPLAGEAAGWAVYYSLSGLANQWVLIPALSGTEFSGPVSATVTLGGTWSQSSTLYLLFADDNANSITDPGYAIDNFQLTATPLTVVGVTITNQPASTSVNERGPVSFTVGASGAPLNYHWLSNGVPIVGANSASYSIASTPFSANGAVYSCIVSNSLGAVPSSGATLTVNPDITAPTLVGAVTSTNGTDVILTFSEAMNPDPAYNDPANFAAFETGTDYGITGITPDLVTVNGNTITLSFTTTLLGDGTNYSVVVGFVYDTSLGVPAPGNVIDPSPSEIAIRRNLLLIDFDGPNNVWSWTAETNLFGTGWETVAYDDSLWPTGPASLGVNTDANPNTIPIRTATAYAGNSAPQFFRRHFFLPAGVTGTTLSIRHLFEDGAVVFLNGQEAGRFNVGAGALSVTTRATVNFTENSPLPAPVALNTAGLVAGDNVIAVVVFQNGRTSSDSIMALELVANIGTFAAGPVTIPVPPASQTVNEGANVTFTVAADGALPLTYQWFRGASPLIGETGPSLTLNGVLPSQADNYSVTVSNSFGASNSPVAVLTVTGDTTPPAFLSAIGDVNLTNITLTIVDAFGLNPSAAQNVANYSVTGPNSLTIESAVLSNGTNVILTTSPRTQYQNYTVTISGIVDLSEAANAATPTSLPLQSVVVLFDYNHVWKYDETGNDLGTTWKDVGFNDSAWLSGSGFFALETSIGPLTLFTNLAGGNGSNTVLNLTNNTLAALGGTNVTFYFRTTSGPLPFDPSAPGNVVRATSYIDDGAIIYVNGVGAMNYNVTNGSTYIDFATATSTEGAGGLITSNLTGFAQANNVIAAEVHQVNMTSSDVAWGMRLEGLVTTFLPVAPPLTITPISATQAEIAWPDSTPGTAQLYSTPTIGGAWTLVPGTPTQSGGFYRVTVNTASGERYYTLRQ